MDERQREGLSRMCRRLSSYPIDNLNSRCCLVFVCLFDAGAIPVTGTPYYEGQRIGDKESYGGRGYGIKTTRKDV